MEKETSKEKYAQLVAILDRIWNKAFPTQGAVRGKQRSSSPQPLAPPVPVEALPANDPNEPNG